MATKDDFSGTEDFFGLPRGSLVKTDKPTYRFEPKTVLPKPRPVVGADADECEVCGCWPCMHTDPSDWKWE